MAEHFGRKDTGVLHTLSFSWWVGHGDSLVLVVGSLLGVQHSYRILGAQVGCGCGGLVFLCCIGFAGSVSSREQGGLTQVFFNAPLLVFAGCPSRSSHAALWSRSTVPSPRLGQQFSVCVWDSLSCASSSFSWIQIVGYNIWLESGMTDAGCAGHTEGTLWGC